MQFTDTWTCHTRLSSECSFPFRHLNKPYFGCITEDDGTSWCAIDADRRSSGSENNYESIGNCKQDCPGGWLRSNIIFVL